MGGGGRWGGGHEFYVFTMTWKLNTYRFLSLRLDTFSNLLLAFDVDQHQIMLYFFNFQLLNNQT